MKIGKESMTGMGIDNIPDGYRIYFPADGDLLVFESGDDAHPGYILAKDIDHRYITVTAESHPHVIVNDVNDRHITDPRMVRKAGPSDWESFNYIMNVWGMDWDERGKAVRSYSSGPVGEPIMVAESLSALKGIVASAIAGGRNSQAGRRMFKDAGKYLDDLQYAIDFMAGAREVKDNGE